jgi:hypothetical protein
MWKRKLILSWIIWSLKCFAIQPITTKLHGIFSDNISQSSLFFYTHREIEQIEEASFSWNCFDMTRCKSIDFVDKWNEGQKSKIGLEKIKQIKAFLLILHIINYISIFKFIIISAEIFGDLNPLLVYRIRLFLKTFSPYVQVNFRGASTTWDYGNCKT